MRLFRSLRSGSGGWELGSGGWLAGWEAEMLGFDGFGEVLERFWEGFEQFWDVLVSPCFSSPRFLVCLDPVWEVLSGS